MANDFLWETPGSLTAYLSTTLNSLANNVIDIGAAINNSSDKKTHMDLELVLASLDLSAQSSPSVVIYGFKSIDGGTNYDTSEDGVSAVSDIPTADKILAGMGLRIDTGAEGKIAVVEGIPIYPGYFKLGLRNTTGQAFGASGNTLKYRTYNLNIV